VYLNTYPIAAAYIKWTRELHQDGMVIKTAMDLAKTNPWTLIKNFRVGIQKTARELAFTPCLELDAPPQKNRRQVSDDAALQIYGGTTQIA
jgi:hypothetical protein